MDSQKKGRLKDIFVPLMIFIIVLASGVFATTVTKDLWIAVTLSNNMPIVFNASQALNNASITLNAGTFVDVTFKFNVSDPDGYNDISDSKVGVNLTFNGVRRSNNTGNCVMDGTPTATTKDYTCEVAVYYYDNASSIWDIVLFAEDVGHNVAKNSSQSIGSTTGSHNITVNSLSAFSLLTPSLVSSASFGDSNKELIVMINNTGNFDFNQINVTPYDLNASVLDFFRLFQNFSINGTPSTNVGNGQNISSGVPIAFNESSGLGATMPHHISGDSDFKGNRSVYIYIDIPINRGLTAGATYNASPASPWQLMTT
jgi:hypothetical protein